MPNTKTSRSSRSNHKKPAVTKRTTSAKTATAVRKPKTASRGTTTKTKRSQRRPLHKTVIHHIKRLGSRGFINKKYLVFLTVFMVIGGGYLAYRSFADTTLVQADGEFTSLAPARILDTRNGTGGYKTPLGPGEIRKVKILGQGGVPASEVRAVVMNVTVTSGTADSFLTVWPAGSARPITSNLNFAAGQTIPNQVTVSVGTDGYVQIFNPSGSVHVIFDVAGYYATANGTPGNRFISITPTRVLDTRNGAGGYKTPLGPGETRRVQITGANGIPKDAISAVAMNVTVTGATAPSFLTVWPSGADRSNTSSLNFAAGQTIANQVTVKVGDDGYVQIFNPSGSVHVIFDVAGYFKTMDTGFARSQQGRFVSLNPARILDTRNGTGGYKTPVGPGETRNIRIADQGGIQSAHVRAVVMNVTVTGGTAPSFLTIWPSDATKTTTSNINFAANQTIANQITVKVGSDGNVQLYNPSGKVHVIFDVAGYYIDSPSTANTYLYGGIFSYAPYVGQPLKNISYQFSATFNGTTPATTLVNDSSFGDYYDSRIDLDQNAKFVFGPEPGIEFYCSPDRCAFLQSRKITYDNPDPYGQDTIKVPYNLVSGKTYVIEKRVMVNEVGYPGTWMETAVTDSTGIKSVLVRHNIGPADLNLRFHDSIGINSYYDTSCNSPTAYSFSLSNVKYNGTMMAGDKFSSEAFDYETNECPGIARVDAVTVNGATGIKLTHGIPTTQRDTTSPKVLNYVVNTDKTIDVTASDSKPIVKILAYIDDGPLFINTLPNCCISQLYAPQVTQKFDATKISSGKHKLRVWVADNSLNSADFTYDITIP